MPGRLFLTRPADQIAEALQLGEVPQDPPRRNIAPGQDVIVATVDGVGRMRWGMIPVGRKNARGRPVMETIVNARSETVFEKSAFEGAKRAIIPADGWYEWTGEKRRKTAWQIAPKSGDLLFFAAIYDVWTAPNGIELPQVAAVTCEPSADVVDIHHRMGVLLHREDLQAWLTGSEEEAKALMRPFPNGNLIVSSADKVDWTAP